MYERIKKSEVLPCLTLATMRTGVVGIVSLGASLLAGSRQTPNKSYDDDLVARMLKEGTKRHGKSELSDLLESNSISLSFSGGTTRTNVNGKIPTKKIDLGLELLAEMLREPLFSPEHLDNLKKRVVTEIAEQKEDTASQAFAHISREVYEESHPNYSQDFDQDIKEVQDASGADLQDFHAQYYGLGSFFIVMTGDVDHDKIADRLKSEFKNWKSGQTSYKPESGKIKKTSSAEKIVHMPDKANVDLVLGQPLYVDTHSREYFALNTAIEILGGHDFSARLMQEVREKRGLTYGISARIRGSYFSDSGYMSVNGIFAPSLWRQGLKVARSVLEKWAKVGVTASELKRRKDMVKGEYLVGLSNSAGVEKALMSILEQNRDLKFVDEYPKIIESLTLSEVNASIKKYIDPKKFVTVASGSI